MSVLLKFFKSGCDTSKVPQLESVTQDAIHEGANGILAVDGLCFTYIMQISQVRRTRTGVVGNGIAVVGMYDPSEERLLKGEASESFSLYYLSQKELYRIIQG